jgi:hypothetical protein
MSVSVFLEASNTPHLFPRPLIPDLPSTLDLPPSASLAEARERIDVGFPFRFFVNGAPASSAQEARISAGASVRIRRASCTPPRS